MSVEFYAITDQFSVAPQLEIGDMQAVVDAGFKSVIINRPDWEIDPAKVGSNLIIQAAKKVGLDIHYQPVTSGQITLENIQEFKQLFQNIPKPILAYCRSGARCANLYQLAQQN